MIYPEILSYGPEKEIKAVVGDSAGDILMWCAGADLKAVLRTEGRDFVRGPAATPTCDIPLAQIGFDTSPSGHACSEERTACGGAKKHPLVLGIV